MAQKLPAALEEKISKFQTSIKESIGKHNYPPELIGNMDETPMYFDMVSNHTIHKKGAKTVSVRSTGAEKRHLTVVLSATADGNMLPAMVIFKGKRMPKEINLPKGWILCMQDKGWMDATLMERWIREIWLKHTGRRNSLLVLDSFKAHLCDNIQNLLARNNTNTAFIPGGCTSKIQPLDVSLNRPFKKVCRSEFSNYCRLQVSRATTPMNKLKTASKQDIIQWLEKAQKYLSSKPVMISKYFKVTGILLHADGSEDNSQQLENDEEDEEENEEEVVDEEDPFEDPFDSCSDQEDS